MDKYDELRNLLINSPDDIERWEKIENHIKNEEESVMEGEEDKCNELFNN